jgi:hypothetical protein
MKGAEDEGVIVAWRTSLGETMGWLHGRRFFVLLVSLMLVLVVYPALQGIAGTHLLGDALYTVVFLAAFQIIFAQRRYRLPALVLGIPTLVGSLAGNVLPGLPRLPMIVGFNVLALVFLTFTVLVLLQGILRTATLSADNIYAALCGYLIIGIGFSHLYAIVEVLAPGSFRSSEDLVAQLRDTDQRRILLTYFSFVTLTTLGYGDIVPGTNAARGLAAVEAVVGQFYIGVFIALLIGIRVVHFLAGRGHDATQGAPGRAGRGGAGSETTRDGPADS